MVAQPTTAPREITPCASAVASPPSPSPLLWPPSRWAWPRAPRPTRGGTSPKTCSCRCCRSTTSTATCSRRAVATRPSGATLDPSNTKVGGAEYLASTLTTLRAKARNSHTVAAGDLIGGSPFLSGLFHDEPAVESLNAMGLDVSSVGNHEFDEGVEELQRMQYGGCHPEDGCYEPWGEGGYPGADFPWLAANVVDEKTGKTVLPGSTIRRVQGVKVGYIGMTLEGTPSLVAQAGIQGIEFRDEVETANATAKRLKKRGVKTIIVLLHEGGFQTGTYQGCTGISGPIVDIAENLDPEIDLVVTGHTHQPYVCNIPDPKGRDRMVTSAASFGRVVTETTLTINPRNGQVKRNKTTSTNHLVTRTNARPDPDRDHQPLERGAATDRQRGGRLDHRRHQPVARPEHRGAAGQPDRRRPARRHLRARERWGADRLHESRRRPRRPDLRARSPAASSRERSPTARPSACSPSATCWSPWT